MLWIGLTGGMGSGKSSVAQVLRELGYKVIDADELAKQAVLPSSSIWSKLIQTFGAEILDSVGGLDRKALGRIVFKDPIKLAQLESLLHPEIRRLADVAKEQARSQGETVAFYDVPLLFEKSMQNLFDQIWVVNAPQDLRIERVQNRDHLSREEILQRMANQLPLADKVKQADVVLENTGDFKSLRQQVQARCQAISSSLI